ncbi:hypothetical protein LAZ67_20001859 [Cordylochernes scorpioides]|uniref:Uncharacterized protein n=1 Tax=Cordylochernes scorpioides TaxID=51811 RepID=A0ABY6LKJ8_9ARAC|nr:hypothetical protein LAZ67_20001859 [Cordylochernes scorpioides]
MYWAPDIIAKIFLQCIKEKNKEDLKEVIEKGKEEIENFGLKLNIGLTKIILSNNIYSFEFQQKQKMYSKTPL